MLPSRDQRGAALLLVLWVVALLTVLAASLLQIIQRSSQSASMALQRVQLQALADSALNRTIWRLTARDPTEHPPLDGQLHPLDITGGQARVAVTDEAGRIDLNAAPMELLQSLFLAETADAIQSENLLNGIDTRRRRSAAPFLVVADLKSVSGMTSDFYGKLESALTVYTGSPQADLRYAQQTVASAMLRQRPTTESSQPIQPVEAVQSLAGRVLRIRVEVTEPGGQMLKQTSVVRLTGDNHQPYWIVEQHS